ncbi:MAG: glycosyltransferase [Pirellulaceae bacterium]
MASDYCPKVSVIINTDGRVNSLSTCLNSLQYLRYPDFEVVVVAGPTRDGTHDLCRAHADRIKFADCPDRNLSMSRNISIQVSSGELIAFLDDDSVPEPEWLNDVVPAFQDSDVAVAGGFLHDHTGKNFQWTFGTLNRYGTADTSWTGPAPHFNFPHSFNYPHVMANSVFRRSAIVEAHGFDEEFEYFLDESDMILRLVDLGWKIAQLKRGFIHHKFMPSHIRNESRVLTSWWSVIKNKTYFSLVNSGGHTTKEQVIAVVQSTIQDFREHVSNAIQKGLLDPKYRKTFELEVEAALRTGLARGLDGRRKLASPDSLRGLPNYRQFPPLLNANQQRCFVFLTKTYPPGSMGGIGRYIHHLAEEIARIGHQVHVLTAGESHDRVDFENGVWVHRICVKKSTPPISLTIPPWIWNYSDSMFEEANAIASRRDIDCVYAPIWDVEGIAFLVHHKYKLVTSLQTTMKFYIDSNPDKAVDAEFLASFAKPMLALEKIVMLESDGIHAISKAIYADIEQAYDIHFSPDRIDTISLGLRDLAAPTTASPDLSSADARSTDALYITFIGRLESRKGIDVFLDIAPEVLNRYPHAYINIVGNDKICNTAGVSFRSLFETANPTLKSHPRLVFHGEVNDEQLLRFYQSSDIIVAPSRFESFGLVHLEAMMFGTPVIGSNIGGMKEIIEDGVTGLLAAPGDSQSLLACIERLLDDEPLRKDMGRNARASYLIKFNVRRMAEDVIRCMEKYTK